MENLIKLCNINGSSGFEDEVSEFIIECAEPFADEIKKDSFGNLYVIKKGKNPKKTVMLASHMDEVGMIVSDITDDGYIKFKILGGIDESVMIAKNVEIGKNKVKGVLGIKAYHLLPKEKRDEKVNYEDMYIDIGVFTKEDAKKLVNIGDGIYFTSVAEKVGNNIKGKALDDRVGCYILLELMKNEFNDNVVYAFTVQEEVGLRGAGVAARFVKPDEAIVVDCTTCLDMLEIEENRISTKSGEGVAITIVDGATFVNNDFRKKLESVSEKYQNKNVPFGGNDAGSIHINNIKTAALSIPGRYIHSRVSTVSVDDINSCIATIKNYLEEKQNA